MPFKSLRYLKASISAPRARALGFLNQGLGIETRREQFARFWEPHLQRSRDAQIRWVRETRDGCSTDSGDSLLVLGAGRLYDLDDQILPTAFSKIVLLDADPLCLPYWKKFAARLTGNTTVEFQEREVTNVLAPWVERATYQCQKAIATNRGDQFGQWQQILRGIKSLAEDPLPRSVFLELEPVTAIVSLNLLSQIPVMWQDSLEKILLKHFSKSFVESHETEWLNVFLPSANALIEQHLRDLNASSARNILLITDLEYLTYRGSHHYGTEGNIEPPVRYKTGKSGDGEWVANPDASPSHEGGTALECELFNPLYTVDLMNEKVRKSRFPGFSSTFHGSWLWHLAPQGLEEKTSGTVHRVGVFEFVRT